MEWSPALVVRLLLGLVALSLVSSNVVFRKQLSSKYRHLRKHLKLSKHKLDAMQEGDRRAAAIDDAMDKLSNLVQDISDGDINAGDQSCIQPDALITIGSAASVVVNVPELFRECKSKYANAPMTEQNANIWCLRDSIWKYEAGSGSGKTDVKVNATNTRSRSRSKRDTHWDDLIKSLEEKGFEKPKRGFRTRQEYRTLSRRQRRRFHKALQKLHEDKTFQKFGDVHRAALESKGAHDGAAFLPWHRVFLSLFEEHLRRVSKNRVSLPYWDSSIDRRMKDLAWQSVMWDVDHLGRGAGEVDNGPFVEFKTPNGPLRRDIGGKSGLISRRSIKRFMKNCQLSNAWPLWEGAHNNVHGWVGGSMEGKNSAYDPVFYLHHCFIDYQWEKFRQHQRNECEIDPSKDYPETNDVKHKNDTAMAGMEFLRNMDGIADFWTDNWFRYEDTPTCKTDCGNTPDLVCGKNNRCVGVRMDNDRKKRRKREAMYRSSPTKPKKEKHVKTKSNKQVFKKIKPKKAKYVKTKSNKQVFKKIKPKKEKHAKTTSNKQVFKKIKPKKEKPAKTKSTKQVFQKRESKPNKMVTMNVPFEIIGGSKTDNISVYIRRNPECGLNPYLATCPSDPAPNTPEEVVDAIWLDEIPYIDEVEVVRKAAVEAKQRVESIPPDTSPNFFPEFPEPGCDEGEDEDDDEEGEYGINRETSVYRYLEYTVKRQGYQTTETRGYRASRIQVAPINPRE